jgi:hypothetical protein
MSGNRSGRVNALACAILDANGDTGRLAEQMRFFSDLTGEDVDQATALAHWVQTEGATLFVRHLLGPMAPVERDSVSA